MSKNIKYTNEPLGKLQVVPDFSHVPKTWSIGMKG